MRVIFLGCGYLGYNLYTLLKKDFETEVWGIDSPYVAKVLEFKEVNAFDPEALNRMDFRDAIVVDTVALVANNARSDEEEAALKEIADKYRTLLSVLKKGGCRRFIFFSSGGTVYGNSETPIPETHPLHPETLYAKSKTTVEQVIQHSDQDWLILRLSNPYGGYQLSGKRQGVIPILIRKAYQNDPFEMWTSGDTVRDYFYITDLAQAIKGLLFNDVNHEIINVGSGRGTSLNEVIHLVEKTTGHSISIETRSSDVPVVHSIVLDISKLHKLTGYTPLVSMEEGIKKETERIREELGLE